MFAWSTKKILKRILNKAEPENVKKSQYALV